MTNFIEDDNKWMLPTPPAWFLQRLFDFDAQLVLVPSRIRLKDEAAKYLLCRRRLRSAGLGDVAMLDNEHPDTNMCYAHGLVPIAPLRFNNGTTTFTEAGCESLLKELKARDTWAFADGDAVVDAIEANELAQKQRERSTLRDNIYHRARDAWRSMQARTGQRNKRASDYHGHARPSQPQVKQRVILTDAS